MSTLSAPRAYNTSALHRHIDKLDQEYRELRGSASMLYRKLIEVNFRFRMQSTFFISDHDLMAVTGFCWRTLSRAKKILLSFGLIQTKASRGRGHATVYTLRPPKDFAIEPQNEARPQQQEDAQQPEQQSKVNNTPKTGLTIDDLKAIKCSNTVKYNWEGFIRKMEEFNPDPEELKLLVELSNYGEIGGVFWSACAEIAKAKQGFTPIKQPVKFILSRYRHER